MSQPGNENALSKYFHTNDMSSSINDAHVHFGPSTQWLPYIDPEVTIEDVLKKMEQHNINKSIVFPNPHVGDKYPELNDMVSKAQKVHPGRIIGFGRVDPRRGEDAVKEVQRIHDLGLKGVKLHPYVECFRPDHPFFDGFFGKINDLGLITLIHTGTLFSSPGHIKPVLYNYPDMKIILGHLQEGCVSLMRDYENVYADTSGCRVYLLEYSAESCEDKILFGSDYPYLNYSVQIEVVKAAEFSDGIKRKILSDNFDRMLPITP